MIEKCRKISERIFYELLIFLTSGNYTKNDDVVPNRYKKLANFCNLKLIKKIDFEILQFYNVPFLE